MFIDNDVASARPRLDKNGDDEDVEHFDTNDERAVEVESWELMADLIWMKLCSDIQTKPPSMYIDDLNIIYKKR